MGEAIPGSTHSCQVLPVLYLKEVIPQCSFEKTTVNDSLPISEKIDAHWEDIKNTNAFILDVRNSSEYESGHLDRALNIPLNELRSRMHELPSEREIWTYCTVGQRSYYAARALQLNRFNARNLSGGIHTYKNLEQA